MNKKSIIVITLLLLLTLASVAFWIMPTWANLFKIKTSIHEAEIKQEQIRLEENDAAALKSQYDKIKQDAESLQRAFFVKDEKIILSEIDSLEKICESHHLDHTLAIEPLPQTSTDSIQKSSIELTITGSLADVMNLLQHFEKDPRYINFESIQISPSESKNSLSRITVVLNGEIYWI